MSLAITPPLPKTRSPKFLFFFSSRRRHTRYWLDWSSDVCSSDLIGLCAGLMLAGDGHEVTVLEPDPTDPPGTPAEAWDGWRRAGVAQFRQPHTLFPRFRQVVDRELPGLVDPLADGGGVWVDYAASLPPSIEDRTPRPGDDRLRFVTGRRPVTAAVGSEEQTSGLPC